MTPYASRVEAHREGVCLASAAKHASSARIQTLLFSHTHPAYTSLDLALHRSAKKSGGAEDDE